MIGEKLKETNDRPTFFVKIDFIKKQKKKKLKLSSKKENQFLTLFTSSAVMTKAPVGRYDSNEGNFTPGEGIRRRINIKIQTII